MINGLSPVARDGVVSSVRGSDERGSVLLITTVMLMFMAGITMALSMNALPATGTVYSGYQHSDRNYIAESALNIGVAFIDDLISSENRTPAQALAQLGDGSGVTIGGKSLTYGITTGTTNNLRVASAVVAGDRTVLLSRPLVHEFEGEKDKVNVQWNHDRAEYLTYGILHTFNKRAEISSSDVTDQFLSDMGNINSAVTGTDQLYFEYPGLYQSLDGLDWTYGFIATYGYTLIFTSEPLNYVGQKVPVMLCKITRDRPFTITYSSWYANVVLNSKNGKLELSSSLKTNAADNYTGLRWSDFDTASGWYDDRLAVCTNNGTCKLNPN